ncbi:hypothetical protein C8J56DRAFT_734197, partial [Mycena floridula]
LEKFDGLTTELIPVKEQPGINAIAFTLKEILDNIAEDVTELAMDSTWKTNAAGYELYSLVTEANGRAIPLAFLFTNSEETAAKGSKDRMLQDVIRYLAERCPNIKFTLSDKDPSEISA